MLNHLLKPRLFSTRIVPYFSLSHSIKEIKSNYLDEIEQSVDLKHVKIETGGRIIGRRKASKNLLFLDIQSNGENI